MIRIMIIIYTFAILAASTLSYTHIHSLHYTDCTDGDVRLMNGSTQYEGRVEVCINDTYFTVCDDFWGREAAEVVCHHLGFSNGSYCKHSVCATQ